MRIQTIEMVEFMAHERTLLELPPTGIFLFTGRNGHGKSSMCEAVSVAFWNKTLRGTPPWPRAATEASVAVGTDNVQVSRSLKRGKQDKVVLAWNRPGEKVYDGESQTKSQKALERIVGDHETWQHSCVFSSADATLFSKASDADRKKLIENVLGLGRFEMAYRACKAKIADKEKEARVHREQARTCGEVLQVLDQRLAEHQEALEDQPAVVTDKERASLKKLETMVASVSGDLASMHEQIRVHQRESGKVEALASTASASYKNWAGKQTCNVCTQPVGKQLLDKLKKTMEAAVSAADKAKAVATAHMSQLEQSYQELQEEQTAILAKRDELHSRVVLADNAALQRTRIERNVAQAQQDIDAKRAELQAAQDALAPLEADLEELKLAEQVLHYRGVRAQILSETLDGLETMTNVWLAELDDEIRIRIKSYTETKTAGVNDAISIEIEGAGDGYGYAAASGGERRRVDVAFLLAIIQLAEAANGRAGDALWLDEVFDSLDDEVVPRLGAALASLAAHRQIFIISHSKAVTNLLPITQHFEVVDGRVSEAA